MLNSRTYLDADGAGQDRLSMIQVGSLVIYSLMVRGSGLRERKMTFCQTFNTTSSALTSARLMENTPTGIDFIRF